MRAQLVDFIGKLKSTRYNTFKIIYGVTPTIPILKIYKVHPYIIIKYRGAYILLWHGRTIDSIVRIVESIIINYNNIVFKNKRLNAKFKTRTYKLHFIL